MEKKIKTILGIHKQITLCLTDNIKGKNKIILSAINELDEEYIDKIKNVESNIKPNFIKDGIKIPERNIYMYGEINFNDTNDINSIKKFNFIKHDSGSWVPSNFDYNNGTIEIENNISKGYFTWDPVKWFKYCHCLIGKPKRIIVYKDSTIIKNVR